jgi:hypothetical protein
VGREGRDRNLAETRLYTLADDSSKVLHLIVIKDQGIQATDIHTNWEFAQSINEMSQKSENEGERPAPQRAAIQKRHSDVGRPKQSGRHP